MAEVTELDNQEEIGEVEAVVNEAKEQPAPEVKPSEEDDIPQEFRGKTVKDLVGMTLHARKEMGRQANELGEIRKLADELIKSQLGKPKEPEQPKEIDFFENPQEAIRRAVETNPEVVAAKQYAVQAQRQLVKQQLQQMHPDMGDILKESDFVEWVKSSPVRQQLLVQADRDYDLTAANELLSTYKELRSIKRQTQDKQVAEVDTTQRDQTLKAASVDTGGSGETMRKVYRRADLINLQLRDPRKFEAMRPEIDRAYQEGRVR